MRERVMIYNMLCFFQSSSFPLGGNEKGALSPNGQDVALAHDEVFVSVKFELGTSILAVKHGVAHLHDHLLVLGAITYGYYFALEGFLFGGVGDDDTADGLLFGRCGHYENSVC